MVFEDAESGMHKSGSGFLKVPKAESARRMFFPVGLDYLIDVLNELFWPLVAS